VSKLARLLDAASKFGVRFERWKVNKKKQTYAKT